MKKIFIAATAAALLTTAAVGAALAAPGSLADPFVTLSYLTDTYYPQAQEDILLRAQQGARPVEQAALARLEELAAGHLAQAGGGEHADAFRRLTLARGDTLALPPGAGLLFEAGNIGLSLASGVLVDVTDGALVTGEGGLAPGHRYVAAEDAVCSLSILSDAALLSVQGRYSLEQAGQLHTPFTDLTEEDWYYSYVRYAYEQGLFQGVTATTFSPNTNMSRAMLATVLSRLSGSAAGQAGDAGFTDVSDGDWFAAAVNWAAGAGVVNGMGDGTFAPNANVTREQMALMLYRYARDYMGLEVSAGGDLSAFTDREEISAWAEQAVSWAVGEGIVNGMGNGALSPGGAATRAEVAAMLQRFSALLS